MRSRTKAGEAGYLWEWMQEGVWKYWNVRRVTSRYILLVPNDDNPTLPSREGHYVLIRWPTPVCWRWSCRHPAHPGTLCSDTWCMCTAGETEDDDDDS